MADVFYIWRLFLSAMMLYHGPDKLSCLNQLKTALYVQKDSFRHVTNTGCHTWQEVNEVVAVLRLQFRAGNRCGLVELKGTAEFGIWGGHGS